MEDVREQVKKIIEEHDLIETGQHIVLGLSGGPDSVCLFHVLADLAKSMDLTIHPVHINHKFRPGDAERDQQYVEDLCRAAGMTCKTYVKDCNAMAEELGMTSEEAGRKARYDAFYDTAEEVAAALGGGTAKKDGSASDKIKETSGKAKAAVRIAVAQNANDQAETILFRLLRGTGTDGLAGMAYQREERGFKVIRPLLDIYRDDIEEYCRKNGLRPVTDHTNEEPVYARNKIRLELLPLLENDYNENIKESLVRLGRIAAEDKDFLWKQTEREYQKLARREERPAGGCERPDGDGERPVGGRDMITMDRETLAGFHKAIRHRLILKAFGEIGLDKDISEERINSADHIIERKQAPKTVEFPHGYRLTVARGEVMFFKTRET